MPVTSHQADHSMNNQNEVELTTFLTVEKGTGSLIATQYTNGNMAAETGTPNDHERPLM